MKNKSNNMTFPFVLHTSKNTGGKPWFGRIFTLYTNPEYKSLCNVEITIPSSFNHIYLKQDDEYATFGIASFLAAIWIKVSPFVPFDIQKIMIRLNEIEGLTGKNDCWGGGNVVGGSPRNAGSKIPPEELQKVIDEVLE
jgi:hypothetical protein